MRQRTSPRQRGTTSSPGTPVHGRLQGQHCGDLSQRPNHNSTCGLSPHGTRGPHETPKAQRASAIPRLTGQEVGGELLWGQGSCSPFPATGAGTPGGWLHWEVHRDRCPRKGHFPGSGSSQGGSTDYPHPLSSSMCRADLFSQWGQAVDTEGTVHSREAVKYSCCLLKSNSV